MHFSPFSSEFRLAGLALTLLWSPFTITTSLAQSQLQWPPLEVVTSLPHPQDPSVTLSLANAINADGTIVVGVQGLAGASSAAVWNTTQSPTVLLGNLPGYSSSFATGVSANGQVVIGNSIKYSNSSLVRAFRWEGGHLQDLGHLSGGNEAFATATNASGEIVVGNADNSSGLTRAFLWQNGIMQDLGTTGGASEAAAENVNADGTVVVGTLNKGNQISGAFRWQNGLMEELNPLTGDVEADAKDVSADGRIIVGHSGDRSTPNATRWVNGKVESLGTLRGDSYSYALGVSDSSGVVVGNSIGAARTRAFRWQNGEMKDLGQLTGAVATHAIDISADGSTITGYSYDGTKYSAFIYRTAIQDLANVQASAIEVANEFANAVDLNSHLARKLREEECHISQGRNACLGVRAGATSLFQGTNAFGGSLTGAVNISDAFKLGASVGTYGEGNTGSTLGLNYGIGVGAFAEYLIGSFPLGSKDTPVRARLDGAWLYSDADVTRGQDFTDVQVGRGSTHFSSRTVGARLIADHQFSENFMISPYIGAYWENTYQAGYDEQTELETIAYIHGSSTSAAAGVFGLRSRFSVFEQLELGFGLQGEVDFFADDVEVSASTNIPGLAHFSVGADRSKNRARFVAEASAAYNMTEQSRVEVLGKVFSTRYQDKLGGDLAVRFSSSF